MKIKKYLIILLIVSVCIYALYFIRVDRNVHGAFGLLLQPQLLLVATLSFVLILIGHLIRSYKFKKILDPVKNSGTRTQFQSLMIGYLFNTVLPFRLGEFVRSFVLGRSLKISASFMFSLVILERAFDGLILGVFGVSLALIPGVLPNQFRAELAILSITLFLVGLIAGYILFALFHQSRWVLRFWHWFTSLLNNRLRNSLRFKV